MTLELMPTSKLVGVAFAGAGKDVVGKAQRCEYSGFVHLLMHMQGHRTNGS